MSSQGYNGGGGGPSSSSSSTTTVTTTTQTVTQTTPVLHLVLEPRPQHNVTWAEDTVDNEHMNKKKSKKCCIYSKPRAFGESSSESEGSDDGAAKPTQKRRGRKFCPWGESPGGNDGNGGGQGSGGGGPAGSDGSGGVTA
eukprot:TRINITY_DN91244_c0_g1_i1.p1 TRINITY_DN91244_c0_g1~~TRINITY_DN91244_c0_g1_i1.p1  ORF type:complete len:140 (-),score=24.58 TRINITY_DN91244_c0_g1_i1:48-467(-)